jgi:hypothetical protein
MLCGLNQAPRAWYEMINEYNHNLYYLNQGGKNIILVLYVDDLVLIGNDNAKH